MPVVPFQELVETALGKKIEQIDRETIEELKNYYLSIFNTPESIGPAFESVKSLSVDIDPTKKIDLANKDAMFGLILIYENNHYQIVIPW